jgi:hypothetical protein
VNHKQEEDDLLVTTKADLADNHADSGVRLYGWFNGGNTIEYFRTADGWFFQF